MNGEKQVVEREVGSRARLCRHVLNACFHSVITAMVEKLRSILFLFV